MKIIDETIKNPKTNQYSRKNISAFIGLMSAVGYSFLPLIIPSFNPHSDIVWAFLLFTASLLGVSTYEKINLPKN